MYPMQGDFVKNLKCSRRLQDHLYPAIKKLTMADPYRDGVDLNTELHALVLTYAGKGIAQLTECN